MTELRIAITECKSGKLQVRTYPMLSKEVTEAEWKAVYTIEDAVIDEIMPAVASNCRVVWREKDSMPEVCGKKEPEGVDRLEKIKSICAAQKFCTGCPFCNSEIKECIFFGQRPHKWNLPLIDRHLSMQGGGK